MTKRDFIFTIALFAIGIIHYKLTGTYPLVIITSALFIGYRIDKID